MNPYSWPMTSASGQETWHGAHNGIPLPAHGVLLIIAGNPQSVRIIAYIDENIEFSVIKTSVAQRLGTIVHPVPQQYSIMIPRVGLVTPEEWVTITCDIPEIGVERKTVNVQMAEWNDPLVHMFIGRRFLSQLLTVSPEATNYRTPPCSQSHVAAPSAAAEQPAPRLFLNGAAAVESPGSVIVQHGNNTPPMGFVTSFLGASSTHQLQVPNSHSPFSITHSTADFNSSSSWAPISAPSNIFSLNTFPTSSVTSGEPANYSLEDNNTTALTQNGGDATSFHFDANYDCDADHDYDADYDYDMLNAQAQAEDELFEGQGDDWTF